MQKIFFLSGFQKGQCVRCDVSRGTWSSGQTVGYCGVREFYCLGCLKHFLDTLMHLPGVMSVLAAVTEASAARATVPPFVPQPIPLRRQA